VKKNGERLPGFEYSVYEEIGRHSVKTGAVTFTDFEVDDKYRIGNVNEGFRIAMEGFNLARSLVGVASVGVARWALDEGLRWIKERKLWGKPIAAFQGVNFKFAELYAELEAVKWLCYKAAWLADRYYRMKDRNISLKDVALAAAAAKLRAPELAAEICCEVMKWHGGMAYFKEVPVYRAWEGVMSYIVGAEGSQNIMKYIIARNIIGEEYTPL
jgi:acyl-CoA dehydrogenase